jgi:hypothetical protein
MPSESGSETLCSLYKTLLNPSLLNESMLDGEGNTEAEKAPSKVTKMLHTTTITGAAVDKDMCRASL